MNLPEQFVDRITQQLGGEVDEFLKSYEQDNLRALRVNTLKGSKNDFIKVNPWNITENDRVSWCSNGFYFNNDAIGKNPLHDAGVYYIQEASAMAPVEKLDVLPGDYVLDLCASPGGKSTQIASYLCNKGLLVCNEINPTRAKNLSENIERMGVANALVTSEDPIDLSGHFPEYFNKILVDAPCSVEGMFRKNPEAVKEWSTDNVKMCAQRQSYILDEAAKMLCEGGRMVYSTCTFAPEEDELTIQAFLERHPEFSLAEQEKLWPHKVKGEGHFMAVLCKEGTVDFNNVGIPAKGYASYINKKDIKEFFEFEKETLKIDIQKIYEPATSGFIRFGDELYLVPEKFPALKGLKVLRLGLHLGTLKKNRFEPSHSLALFLKKEDVLNCTDIGTEDAVRFINGQTLNVNGNKGWHLICVNGYSLGFGKLSQGIMKNHYPKGLRK